MKKNYKSTGYNFILSGVPRSGTSLISSLICKLENAYCFNEVYYQPDKLSENLNNARKLLINGQGVPNKYTKKQLTTNTSSEVELKVKKAEGIYNKNAAVGSKVNTPYMTYIQYLIDHPDINKYIFVIRNPIYNIASFHNREGLNVKNCLPNNLDQRFFSFPMISKTTIERQAEIVNHILYLIYKLMLHKDVEVIRYEDLMEIPFAVLTIIAAHLKVRVPKELNKLEFESKNVDKNYDMDYTKLRKAVKEYCPMRKKFGYK